jgi:hypothetical protein
MSSDDRLARVIVVTFECADVLLHEAIDSPNPRRPDRRRKRWANLGLTSRYEGREAMEAKAACVRAVKLPPEGAEAAVL